MLINVHSIAGELCTDAYSGTQLFRSIVAALAETDVVTIDFAGCRVGCAAFFNHSISHLYSEFSAGELNQRVRIINLEPWLEETLRVCSRHSKRYWEAKNAIDN
jgi:STAS-like domain of unknown function (DUF4325)